MRLVSAAFAWAHLLALASLTVALAACDGEAAACADRDDADCGDGCVLSADYGCLDACSSEDDCGTATCLMVELAQETADGTTLGNACVSARDP